MKEIVLRRGSWYSYGDTRSVILSILIYNNTLFDALFAKMHDSFEVALIPCLLHAIECTCALDIQSSQGYESFLAIHLCLIIYFLMHYLQSCMAILK